jgi:hypothetical protein
MKKLIGTLFGCVHPTTHKPSFVKLGESGYTPSTGAHTRNCIMLMIAEQGPIVTEAALAGSIFGWDIPAAQPAVKYATPRTTFALHIDSPTSGRLESVGWGVIATVTFRPEMGLEDALQDLVNQANTDPKGA